MRAILGGLNNASLTLSILICDSPELHKLLFGMSLRSTLPAATIQFLPIVINSLITGQEPINEFSLIFTAPFIEALLPMKQVSFKTE
jgi:hypothetical protein